MADYLCPVCRATLKRDLKNGISLGTHFKILLTTLAISGGIYMALGLSASVKAALFYFPLWAAAEFVYWIQLREETRCRRCHFDPMLYRRDWRMARSKVEKRLGDLSADLQKEIMDRVQVIEAHNKQRRQASSKET